MGSAQHPADPWCCTWDRAGHLAEPGGLFCPESRVRREGTGPVNHKVEQCGPSQMAGRLQQPQLARNKLQGPINHSQSQSRSKRTAWGSWLQGEGRAEGPKLGHSLCTPKLTPQGWLQLHGAPQGTHNDGS